MSTIESFGVDRDQWGRPKIIPVGAGPYDDLISYTRATTLAKTLEEMNGVHKWELGLLARGLVGRPDLVALIGSEVSAQLAATDDKTERQHVQAVNKLIGEAIEFGGRNVAANLGTALHAYTEQLDLGAELWGVPAELLADVEAYRQATAHLYMLAVEMFVVCDGLEVAGTLDRLCQVKADQHALPRIFDLKTGRRVDKYGHGAIATQLAEYAHGSIYDPQTGQRTPLEVDQEVALVLHLPVGTGTATLFEVDIAAGWEAARHAKWAMGWRKRHDLFHPVASVKVEAPADPVVAAIAAAQTYQELRDLYDRAIVDGRTPAELLPLCTARRDELKAAGA